MGSVSQKPGSRDSFRRKAWRLQAGWRRKTKTGLGCVAGGPIWLWARRASARRAPVRDKERICLGTLDRIPVAVLVRDGGHVPEFEPVAAFASRDRDVSAPAL